jgi:hypothetical protein
VLEEFVVLHRQLQLRSQLLLAPHPRLLRPSTLLLFKGPVVIGKAGGLSTDDEIRAFIQESSTEMTVFEQLMNLFFLVDMILVFFSAFLDSDYNTIDNHKVMLIFVITQSRRSQ